MPDPRNQLKAALVNPDSYASVLVVIALDEYGMEALEWDPETLLVEIEEDFGIKLPDTNFDRLCAGIQLVTTDKFYKSLPDFVQLCPVLSGHNISTDLDLPDALECGWGITECLLLSPPEEDEAEPFTPEICGFLGQILAAEGVRNPIGVLKIAELPSQTEEGADDFSDDPAMYSAVYDVSNARAQDIEDRLKGSVHELLMQLSQLPLRNGSGANVLQALQRNRK